MTLRRWLTKLRGIVETIMERRILDVRGRLVGKDLLILERRSGLIGWDLDRLHVRGGRSCSDDCIEEGGRRGVLTVYGVVLLVYVCGDHFLGFPLLFVGRGYLTDWSIGRRG